MEMRGQPWVASSCLLPCFRQDLLSFDSAVLAIRYMHHVIWPIRQVSTHPPATASPLPVPLFRVRKAGHTVAKVDSE